MVSLNNRKEQLKAIHAKKKAAFGQMSKRGFVGTSPAKPKGSWIGFVKAHKNIRTPKGLLDLKAISKLYKKR